ncbi:MAG: hypothetical protein A2632_00520 [Candidatus Pacebacteria bacterium RIFCSPHIGHO2_01_FULL_46_16]|nr:MAG: hypothetical protein A2632_00520 [Candidatus Pacebacteria bacterium RIFCSPHIGHO2_01_FULL_46_16]OGJ38718.1 MAG: hypothetical protein A3A82_03245 [Candidatus Pacebacteria bacterium RIFCSPLOWO2_01_FULL_47_12]
MSKIAFDIGSTVTRVVVGGEVLFQQPTCLALERESGAMMAIGSQAYSLLGKTARQLEIHFPVLAGVVADTTNLSLYLTKVFKQLPTATSMSLASLLLGRQVVVAYSPCSTSTQKARLALVFRQLGMRTQLVLRPEAVVAYLAKKQPIQSSCLVDIGGSATVCSIVTNGIHVQSHCIPWGGIQLTERVQQYLLREEQLAVGWHEAERLKCALAAVFSLQTLAKYRDHKGVVRGQDTLTHVGKTLVITREQLATVVQPQIEELLAGVTEFLALLPREMVTSILESGVTLVGGGSQLSGLADLLQEKLACKVAVSEQPDIVCVRGLL